jgi:DNA-binding transcriptional MocR family regulator
MNSNRVDAGLTDASSRSLAEMLAISRNTVLSTYERLSVAGYLEDQIGKPHRGESPSIVLDWQRDQFGVVLKRVLNF